MLTIYCNVIVEFPIETAAGILELIFPFLVLMKRNFLDFLFYFYIKEKKSRLKKCCCIKPEFYILEGNFSWKLVQSLITLKVFCDSKQPRIFQRKITATWCDDLQFYVTKNSSFFALKFVTIKNAFKEQKNFEYKNFIKEFKF